MASKGQGVERSSIEQVLGAASIVLSIVVMFDAWSGGVIREALGRLTYRAPRSAPAEDIYGVAEEARAFLGSDEAESYLGREGEDVAKDVVPDLWLPDR